MDNSVNRVRPKALIFACLLAGVICASPALGKPCTPSDAQMADSLIDELGSWAQVAQMQGRYAQCDDGDIAEGNSEAVARLLVDHWGTLSDLAKLIRREPRLQDFVLRHIDTTLDTADLEQIKTLSASACPPSLASLCRKLQLAAGSATR